MRISVLISTYNQPAALERALWGWALQSHRDYELLVADDGSGPETAAVIERVGAATGLRPVHVWQEDRGFRKCEVLNRAILASSGDYLIFSDGDCIPRRDLVEVHASRAERGYFLSGGYLRLPAEVSDRITVEDVRSGRFAELAWLRGQGWRPGRRALRLLRSRRAAAVLDRLTTTKAQFGGHNASTWREHLLAVNGFECEMGYGGLDRALGYRLRNLGLRGRKVRYQTVCVHLYHEKPYKTAETLRRNREILDRIVHGRETRARIGLAEIAGGWAGVG